MVGVEAAARGGSPIAAGPQRRLRRGARLYMAGSEPDQVWFVHAGLVKVQAAGTDGAAVLIAFRGAGEWLGEHAALDQRRRRNRL